MYKSSIDYVRDFITENYKHNRLFGRGDQYAEIVIYSHIRHFLDHGYTLISRFESKTGEVIYFPGKPNTL